MVQFVRSAPIDEGAYIGSRYGTCAMTRCRCLMTNTAPDAMSLCREWEPTGDTSWGEMTARLKRESADHE